MPCQDYALSGLCGDTAYAVVSDGCSTGGHTDVGARLVALTTIQAIRETWVNRGDSICPEHVSAVQSNGLFDNMRTLGLSRNDMLATCVYAYLSPATSFVHLQGDGVVAVRWRDGSLWMFRYEWESNTPFYPAYAIDGRNEFVRSHGGDIAALRVARTTCIVDSAGFPFSLAAQQYTLEQGIRGITVTLDGDIDDIDLVAVFTDGVTQISGVDWRDAVQSLLAFKSTGGEFAKRRMIRYVNDLRRDGGGPTDDIAYAVVRVEHS